MSEAPPPSVLKVIDKQSHEKPGYELLKVPGSTICRSGPLLVAIEQKQDASGVLVRSRSTSESRLDSIATNWNTSESVPVLKLMCGCSLGQRVRMQHSHTVVVKYALFSLLGMLNTLPFDTQSPQICDSNAIIGTILREPCAHIKGDNFIIREGYVYYSTQDRVLSLTTPGSGFIYGVRAWHHYYQRQGQPILPNRLPSFRRLLRSVHAEDGKNHAHQ
ncbi:hypothetical protein VNO77_02666 [Canavalia gladiata]|uniref:Uncharacterized protein n=1 Tax=Canavalia gladiata TaxID=3824 RepID=A0AAN9MU21_CANGL